MSARCVRPSQKREYPENVTVWAAPLLVHGNRTKVGAKDDCKADERDKRRHGPGGEPHGSEPVKSHSSKQCSECS